MRTRSIVALCGCIMFTASIWAGRPVMAADWPQWRGPARDGHVTGFGAPKTWPEQLKRHWKVEVGEGHSCPVVAGDRVFVFARQGENEVVRALALGDGKQQWVQSYPAAFEMSPYARPHGKGPKSTPAVAGGRLVTLGIGDILSCWDTASGKMFWQHDFSKKYTATSSIFYGMAASPLLNENTLIAYIGAYGDGALSAFDPTTGQIRWQWSGDGPAYASPIVAMLAGVRQVVTQSQSACVGVAANDGALLWKLPYKTEYDQNIITPVVAGELVIFSGLDKGTTAYRLVNSAGKWSPEQVWHNSDISMYMTSPVVVGKQLFGLSPQKKGQFFCLDTATGKLLWTSDGRMGENAAILCVGDVLLALTTDSQLIVFRASEARFEPLARYTVADTPTWAYPAIVGNTVLIKDRSSLALWTVD
jgi:outer membrane protein assembly factor BamB